MEIILLKIIGIYLIAIFLLIFLKGICKALYDYFIFDLFGQIANFIETILFWLEIIYVGIFIILLSLLFIKFIIFLINF